MSETFPIPPAPVEFATVSFRHFSVRCPSSFVGCLRFTDEIHRVKNLNPNQRVSAAAY
jgi:hypothetical protein